MTNSSFPEKVGLVETLARPGGNVTGFSNVNPQLVGKRLELIKEIAPRTSRLAALWNPTNPVEAMGLREITTAAAMVGGLEVVSVEVRTPEEHPAAFATMIARRVDGLQVFGSPVNFKNMQLIADFALTNRIVSSYDDRSFVDAGGLFSYASSFIDSYRRSATYVDKILKGAKPADLPIQHPTKFEFVLNLKTAKTLGLTIPGALLMRVDDLVQ
jgi:putative ABC transport system substrate-binding protein